MDETSSKLARWFLQQGLRPGDRVAIHWPNSLQTVRLYFAVFKAGLVAVPVNPRLKPAEIAYIFDQARPCCASASRRLSLWRSRLDKPANLRHASGRRWTRRTPSRAKPPG